MNTRATPDTVAAWATGAGLGLITLMVVWLVTNRVATHLWDAPIGPIVAFSVAVVVGLVTAWVSARRLARSARAWSPPG